MFVALKFTVPGYSPLPELGADKLGPGLYVQSIRDSLSRPTELLKYHKFRNGEKGLLIASSVNKFQKHP